MKDQRQNSPEEIDKMIGVESVKLLSISQSLIKNYWDYRKGKYCGIAFHAIDLLKKFERTPSERMSLGHYFEFLCTGQTLRDGTEPERPVTSTGKPTALAIRMEAQAERFKDMIVEKDIDILDTGTVWEYPDHKNGFKYKGVLDVLAIVDGYESIVDIKSSGLIGNQWEDYGWDENTFNMRDKLSLQVVFYKWLAWKVKGIIDIPFYFAIHSSANEVDSLFWRVNLIDFEVAMSHFEDMILTSVKDIKMLSEFGFTAHPDVKRCASCPVAVECGFKVTIPETIEITIDGIYVL